ncbi:MAG: hypothetical protein HY268_34495 [Deltaproteobacteria bacterium]|nr:hypothetical protein [Deltaproteobacteria bacterium]
MDLPTKELFSSLPVPAQVVRLEQVDAKTRQELILSARNSLDLTRSLSAETLFYTLKEIGLADSVDLLALASPTQVRDMVDLDCWRKDYLEDRRLLAWLMLLDEAGSGKLGEWFLHADIEVIVLLVKRHLEVIRKAEVEEDPDFNQARYFTFDDQYLLRFLGEAEPILSLLLERLRVLDYNSYTHILEWSLLDLESALEEEALHWREARMADRGYPSYDEVRTVFNYVALESLSLERYRRQTLSQMRFAMDEELIPADHALMLLDVRDSFLIQALAALPTEDLEPLRQELALLTNQVVIAEACDPSDLAAVRRCAELVHDYLDIGLAYLSKGEPGEATRLLHETMLRPFFQVGVSLTLSLQQQVRQLDTNLRRGGMTDWQAYLDSPFQETCAGVQRRLPLFFRGLETPGEILSQPFQSLAEIRRVETLLAQIPLWFATLQRWELLPKGQAPEGVTLGVLWNTAFAHWVVKQEREVRPLSRADLITLQQRLRQTTVAAQSTAFLALAAAQLNLTHEETEALRTLASHAGEKLQDLLGIEAATIDLRFIEGVLVARQ